jgi:predicted 3-demethylubiquinone-9 3-methyltransferase (glyoxalase superfamily)
LSVGRKIVTGFSGDSDHALFLIVSVLPMTTTGSIEIPTIVFDCLMIARTFITASRDNSVSLRQISVMKKINPFLWFDSEAEEAAKFYVGIFKNSKIGRITHYGEDGPRPKGSLMTVEFTLDRVDFVALNGGPQFKFTEAISFSVNCETQDEIDYFWEKLSTDGGSTGRCGWLKDKFGISWQVNPVFLGDMLADRDVEKANRVMKAMMEMDKIDIAALENAARG